MQTEFLDGNDFKNLLESALTNLADKYKEVDSLNVYPVPDGDTGTNMYLTLTAAVEEASKSINCSIDVIAEAASRGALLGARGNSGVILSQLFRGISLKLNKKRKVTGKVFAEALEEGVKTAYKAVTRPVEGTILTVAREAAIEALTMAENTISLTDILEKACEGAERTLANTPQMLPVLKDAGVVDAGGMGWLIILRGFANGLKNGIKYTSNEAGKEVCEAVSAVYLKEESELEYPYCTEFILKHNIEDTNVLKTELEGLGDSLIVAGIEGITKVHIHTAHPGTVLETCLKYGHLTNIKIGNMMEQAAGSPDLQPEKKYGIISVSAGDGIKRVMESLGADVIIQGGQTMNPSTREILEAINKINANKIIVLPNNKNIIMTAKQAASASLKQVAVVPTNTVPEGLAALMAVKEGTGFNSTIEDMTKAAARVKTGEVTYAVRKTRINGHEIDTGDLIGLYNGEIAAAGTDVKTVTINLLDFMITSDDEICTLYFGEKVKETEAEELIRLLEEKFSDIEFEVIDGGQPFYYYFISIE